VVVLSFDADLAKGAVSHVNILPLDDLALAAILVLVYGFDTIQIDFVVKVNVSGAEARIH